MPITLDAEVRAEKGRVTAGLPSLSHVERATRDYRGRQREKARNAVADADAKHQAATAPDTGRSRTVKAACDGIPLHSDQLIRRLQKLNPNLYFERAIADAARMGVYVLDASVEGGKRFIVGMHSQRLMPEFSVFDKDTAKEKERGWRTVLQALIRARLVNQAKADALFGPPSKDSKNWALLMGNRQL